MNCTTDSRNICRRILLRQANVLFSTSNSRRISFPNCPSRFYHTLHSILPLSNFHQQVLLGFSNDGAYLIGYSRPSSMEYCLHLQEFDRRHVVKKLALFQCKSVEAPAPSSHDIHHEPMRLQIWQSTDHDLFVVLGSRILHGPMFGSTSLALHGTVFHRPSVEFNSEEISLHFTMMIASPYPSNEPWQLLTMPNQRYLMVLNGGDTIEIAGFSIRRAHSYRNCQFMTRKTVQELPSWWKQSLEWSTRTEVNSGGNRFLNLDSNYTFDVESFLVTIIQASSKLQQYRIRDYDLKIVTVLDGNRGLLLSSVLQLSSLIGVRHSDSRGTLPSSSRSTADKTLDQLHVAVVFTITFETLEAEMMWMMMHPGPRGKSTAAPRSITNLSNTLVARLRAQGSQRRPSPAADEWNNDNVISCNPLKELRHPFSPVVIRHDE